MGIGELTKGVRSNENGVTSMNDSYKSSATPTKPRIDSYTAFHHARNHRPHERYRKCIVDMKLERPLGIIIAMMRANIEESPYQVQIFAGDIRYLKNRADALAHKLSGGFNGLLTILDEDWDFSSSGRLQYSSELSNCLLENMRRANVDFGYHNHNRYI